MIVGSRLSAVAVLAVIGLAWMFTDTRARGSGLVQDVTAATAVGWQSPQPSMGNPVSLQAVVGATGFAAHNWLGSCIRQ